MLRCEAGGDARAGCTGQGVFLPSGRGGTITELIDVVLGTQDQFMLKERRTGRRRRRLTFVPTDEELVSVISRRYQQ